MNKFKKVKNAEWPKSVDGEVEYKWTLRDQEKKHIKLTLHLRSKITSKQRLLKPLFRVTRLEPDQTPPDCKQRPTIGDYHSSFYNGVVGRIYLTISNYSDRCDAGRYKISYWTGYKLEKRLGWYILEDMEFHRKIKFS